MTALFRTGTAGRGNEWARPLTLAAFVATAPSFAAGAAAGVALAADVDPTSATIGEPVKLTVSITAPELARIAIQDPFRPDDKTSTWTLLNRLDHPDEKLSSGEMRRRIEYTLAAFRTGDLELPPYYVSYQPTDAPATTATLPQQSVHIGSVLPADAASVARNDIKPPVEFPYPRWIPLAAVLAALLAAALLVRAYWAIIRRRMRDVLSPPRRIDLWALDELAALENERLIEQKKLREYYTRLADVTRTYLGRLYGFNAMDLTTTELLWRLTDSTEAPRDARRLVEELLNEADLVKFAKHDPESHVCRRSLEKGREIVAATRSILDPAPTPAPIATSESAPAAPAGVRLSKADGVAAAVSSPPAGALRPARRDDGPEERV